MLIQLANDFGLDYDNIIDNYNPDTLNPKGMEKLVSKRCFDKFKEEHPNTKFSNWLE